MSHTIASAFVSLPKIGEILADSPIDRYLRSLNNLDFISAVKMFEPEGKIELPFELPLVGRPCILEYMKSEYQGIEWIAENSRILEIADGSIVVRVTGKIRIPWFGSRTEIKQIWDFYLSERGRIQSLKTDSPLPDNSTSPISFGEKPRSQNLPTFNG